SIVETFKRLAEKKAECIQMVLAEEVDKNMKTLESVDKNH
ncbi:17015_t:CDS:2, partial [Dentiscutata heterogama]